MSEQIPSNPEPASLKNPSGFSRDWKRFNNQLTRSRLVWYAVVKQIPDFLTLLRLILAVVLFGSGAVDGQAAPARDIWLLVIGWTTDMADGRISRSIRKEPKLVGLRLVWPDALATKYRLITAGFLQQKTKNTSWLGQHDVYVDMIVSIAVLGYMAVTALLPVWLLLAYLLVWGAVFFRWGIPDIFAQIFQNPIYAAFVYLTVRAEPAVLPWLLLWAGIALAFFWRRMVQLLESVFRAVRR